MSGWACDRFDSWYRWVDECQSIRLKAYRFYLLRPRDEIDTCVAEVEVDGTVICSLNFCKSMDSAMSSAETLLTTYADRINKAVEAMKTVT